MVITSDHGEHFGEHGLMSHQYSVYEPLVRVPLLVRFPARFSAGREERMVQSHDVYPTILELAGIGWKPLPGQTCQSLLQPASGVRFGISEYLEPMMGAVQKACVEHLELDCTHFNRRLRVIQRDNLKLICFSEFHSGLNQTFELYDLANDPTESRNLADQKLDVTRELTAALDAWTRSFEPYAANSAPRATQPPSTSPNQFKAMRGLGYGQ